MRDLLRQWRTRLDDPDRPDEFDVKTLLTRLNLRVPRGLRLGPGLKDVAPPFPGPYAVKVCTPDILHKTDCGGLQLNLEAGDLPRALQRLHRRFPETPVLVEKMVGFEGPEMIIGGLVDPVFGPAVMVGAGGILTEIFQDVAFRLAPLAQAEAGRMLADLKIHPVFEGYRGLRADAQALAGLLVVVSRLVEALGRRFDQLDLNPVVWSGDAWTILDAKMMLRAQL